MPKVEVIDERREIRAGDVVILGSGRAFLVVESQWKSRNEHSGEDKTLKGLVDVEFGVLLRVSGFTVREIREGLIIGGHRPASIKVYEGNLTNVTVVVSELS